MGGSAVMLSTWKGGMQGFVVDQRRYHGLWGRVSVTGHIVLRTVRMYSSTDLLETQQYLSLCEPRNRGPALRRGRRGW